MKVPLSAIWKFWSDSTFFALLMISALAAWSPATWAAGACSASMGKATLNEYNHQGNFVEVKTLVAGTSFTNWKVRIYTGVGSYKERALPASGANVCGSYQVVTFASNETPPNADVVLLDANNDVVDILRGRTGGSITAYYTKPACNYVGPSTDLTGVNSGQKGIDRMPDGTGGWRNTPGTGSGSYTTLCAGNAPNTSTSVNLAMTKTVSPASIPLNGNATFTLTVSNAGPDTATSLQIADTLPAGLAYVSNTAPTVGVFSASSLLWDISTLANGASASMTLTVQGTSAGTWSNTAVVGSDNTETAVANNTGTASLAVLPSLSIANATKVEGNAGTSPMTFTVTQSAVSNVATTVTYSMSGGTATGGICGAANVDYANTGGTATIAAGQTTATFSVSVCGDTTYEGDESFTVTLTSPVNATVPVGTATGTILNDDAPPLVAEYRFDETVWNGTSGEIKDSSGNNLHATATLATNATGTPGPAYALGAQSTCRYGVFGTGGVNSYVRLPDAFPGLSGSFSISAWINSNNAAAGAQRVFVRDDESNGWAMSLADFTNTAILRFFNRSVSFNSPSGGVVSAGGVAIDTSFQLSSNTWYFVALTVDTVGQTVVMYVYDAGGVQRSKMSASFTGTWTPGTGATAIGAETSASSETNLPFVGRIDEVRVFSGAMTQTLVEALLPTVRPCAAVDHVRIEHDGQGLSCQGETLTVKACADADAGSPAACTAYTGGITGNVLVKSGSTVLATVPFTIASGSSSTTVTAAVASAPGVTFETSGLSVTPSGSSAWTCWNSATPPSSSCAMAVAACASGGFNCLDSTITPYSLAGARLYTKLAGTPFNFDVVALNSTVPPTVETNYAVTGGITRQVTVELFDDTIPAASCSAYSSPLSSQTLTFNSTDAGRKKIVDVTLSPAYKKLMCRVTDTTGGSTVYGCSSDDFAVRPMQLTVSAPVLSNTGLTGTPKAIAGSAFTLTAAAGVAAGYTGTAPALDETKVQDHSSAIIATGTLSGVFSAGTGSSASGTTFKYLDVGNIKFLADAVIDSIFTSVDQVGDCVTGSTSNILTGNKYGCNIGSAASATMGRWYPSHYSFAGTLTPACNGFTYMDQHALGVALTLKAHASIGGAAAATDPVVSRYTSGYTNLAAVTISGYDDATAAAVAVTRLGSPRYPALPVFSALPTMPDKSLWNIGLFQINNSFAFTKLATPDGSYEQFKLKAALADPDGSLLIGTAAAQETNSTKIRYGRVKLTNAYGSEFLALPVPVALQYWSGNWQQNTLDTCTSILASQFAWTFPAGTLARPNGLSACKSHVTVGGTAPNYTVALSAPGANNAGWANLALNLDTTAVGSSCATVTPGTATTANTPWLLYEWTTGSGPSNPKATATFGVYKSPLIYRRENY